MNKPQLQAAFDRHLRATAHAIINVRGERGPCRLCAAPRGQQHSSNCAIWPLISSRGAYRKEQEGPCPAVDTGAINVMIGESP